MARFDWTCPRCGKPKHGSYPTRAQPHCIDCNLELWNEGDAAREALADRHVRQVAEYTLRVFLSQI